MKAMIFAAGLGTRLKPLTDTMPKALVPVCGQPLLYHVITKLVAAGYDDIVVNVHHFPDQITDYLRSNDFGARIAVSDERDFLRETGGGIRYARPYLLGSEDGVLFQNLCHPRHHKREGPTCGRGRVATVLEEHPILRAESFLVHNVDIVSNLDLNWLREQHREGALATLVVSERKTQRYFLFDEDGRLKGWTNLATGEVRSPYGDIDPSKCRKLAFAGIHLISPAIFEAFDKLGFGERFSITDFYLKACADYPIYAAVPPDFTMVDVGKKETLSEAERVCETIILR
ncbi:MAG: nucleotidyltransferase family protein [Bacteroidales bacterium]|nr:nucleotidyltransferase family protein [Bacteroidales bacterium]